MITILSENATVKQAIEELLTEIPNSAEKELTVLPLSGGSGFCAQKRDGIWTLRYETVSALMRGVTRLFEIDGYQDELSETAAFESLGLMIDASQNASPKLETLRRLCRLAAAEGYNTLLLKTVYGEQLTDAVTPESLCGRYTVEEIQTLEQYAATLGLELVPYLPLAEIKPTKANSLRATVECAVSILSGLLQSRRIQLGFDRPALPGCGPYPSLSDLFSTEESHAELVDLLQHVTSCGYKVSVGATVMDSVEKLPQGVVPCLSECTSVNREIYRQGLGRLWEKTDEVGFAGGDNGWYGIIPLSWLNHAVTCNTLPVLLERPPKEVTVTMWRDEGGACSWFSTLPVLFAYGEACWARQYDTNRLSDRMLAITGMDFYDAVTLEDFQAIRCRMNTGRIAVNPGKYMFYDDILTGDFWYHSAGATTLCRNTAEWMKEKLGRVGCYDWIYETLIAYGEVLAQKSLLQHKLYRAYQEKNMEKLTEITRTRFDSLHTALADFTARLSAQWQKENREDGLDLLSERVALVSRRAEAARKTLEDFLNGKVESIPQLEREKLPYRYEEGLIHDRAAILINRTEDILSGNTKKEVMTDKT